MGGIVAMALLGGFVAWRCYTWGFAHGAEAAWEVGEEAVRRERARCRDLRMTQVFGPRAERLTRPHHAECN